MERKKIRLTVVALENHVCPDWKNDPWYESYVELKEDEEIIGKTENMDQPQWEQSFDLEIDNEKQITFNIYQFNTRMQTTRLAGSCQLYGVYITDALKEGTLKQPVKPNGSLVLEVLEVLEVKRGEGAEKFFPVNGHKFVPKAFNEPVFCAACGDFIWGFGQQGLSCEGCKMTLHKWCYTDVVNPCKRTVLNDDENVSVYKVTPGIQHNFNTATFFRPRYCDHCGKLLVGIRNQGLTCQNNSCFTTVHSFCAEFCCSTCGVNMAQQTKAIREIRRKQEEARRKQEASLNRKEDENLEIEVNRTRRGSRVSKPGKPVKLNLSHFKLKTVLGRGGYGKVILAERISDKRLCAIKAVSKKDVLSQDSASITFLEREILALGDDCRFLTALYAAFQTKERLFFVMEFVSGGDLFHHIVESKRFDEKRTAFHTTELVLALEFLHERGYIHRDIKPENVMLTMEGHTKLTDFGMCKKDMKDINGNWLTTTTFCGTPSFMAPEILLYKKYGASVDWWALGILVFNMLVGAPPFQARGDAIFKKIKTGRVIFPAKVEISRESKKFVNALLEKDPQKRIGSPKMDGNGKPIPGGGAEEVKEHPYFHGTDWDAYKQGKVTPPFVPKMKGAGDTSNFDREFTDETANITQIRLKANQVRQCETGFPEFSFTAKSF